MYDHLAIGNLFCAISPKLQHYVFVTSNILEDIKGHSYSLVTWSSDWCSATAV